MSQTDAVVDFLRDTVLAVRDGISFTYANEYEFNSIHDKQYPAVLLKPLRYDQSRVDYTTNRQYRVTMLFYALDKPDGHEEETQEILAQTDEVLTAFSARLNLNSPTNDENTLLELTTDTVLISNETVVERIKFTSDCATGWEYSFVLEVPDQFDYCSMYD